MNGERKWRCDGIHTICKFEAEFLQSGAEQSQVWHSGKKIGNSFQLLISMSGYHHPLILWLRGLKESCQPSLHFDPF